MLGISRRARWGMLGMVVLAAIVGWLWHASREARRLPAPQAPHRADGYEGSSGMGADGFGGFPSQPPPP